ncbi:PIN domain-containing protein [Leptospira soteropolitanensis]|uniref:PIN domain-containing protein n=2 Tax=Leptospira soteropolitanensis TaxID=2950025 RepID=A0AAW5VUD1_9LEPT|nr:PIN domain-containing protein [Leptospira soteropolitanensis]MCW7502362.1 PIN domain-containing protein [Leptospira soteropolitanensis]MCW7532324.1 PIN domain-containing protein [Leptospira soteropolitanensis]
MAKILLDTCTWLDLAKPKFGEIFNELKNQIDEGITILLTCEIIREEWNNNKTRIIEEILTSIRSHAKSALKMGELLQTSERLELYKIVEKYSKIEQEQENLANQYFDQVEKLLLGSTVYKIDSKLKLEMTDRALLKKAPFHNSKNNMADALLYFGAIQFLEKETEIANDLIFVTQNHKDFCEPLNLNNLHPDLKKSNVYFYNNLAQALKMRKEIIDEMDEYHEGQFWRWIEMQADIARGK